MWTDENYCKKPWNKYSNIILREVKAVTEGNQVK